jgi:hypothetical protein
MDDDQRMRLALLEPLVGNWRIEAPVFPLPRDAADQARMSFEWVLGGAFLIQRSSVPVPEAPDGLSVIGTDQGDGYTQHYFDSRGIARVYAMTFDGREWTLERHTPDFTPLPFHQRWLGAFSDPDTIEGRWEKSPDGQEWALDFELVYSRVK